MGPYKKVRNATAIDDGWQIYDADGGVIAILDTEAMADALLYSLACSHPTDYEKALSTFMDCIENTGGITKDGDDNWVPVADEQWIDLGEAYRQACRVSGRAPIIAQQKGATTYKVTCQDGSVHQVPATVWPDDCMKAGDTYNPENTLWWDDIVDGLRDHVPGNSEIVEVEVKP